MPRRMSSSCGQQELSIELRLCSALGAGTMGTSSTLLSKSLYFQINVFLDAFFFGGRGVKEEENCERNN